MGNPAMKIPKHLQEKVEDEMQSYSKGYHEYAFRDGCEFMFEQLSGVVEALEFYAEGMPDKNGLKRTDGMMAREALKRLRGDE